MVDQDSIYLNGLNKMALALHPSGQADESHNTSRIPEDLVPKAASYAEAALIGDVYNLSAGFADPEKSSIR